MQQLPSATCAEPFERLARGLSGSELQSLLLEVMQQRSAARTLVELDEAIAFRAT